MTTKSVKDIAYTYIEMPGYITKIVDTPEFYRLRHLRYLGAVSYVYPSATHTRFEHSLGVYHLTHLLLAHLHYYLPSVLTSHVVKLVEIAALVHDIGHGPFSHLFEQIYLIVSDESHVFRSHEEVGCDVFRKLVAPLQTELELTNSDVDTICCLICGREPRNATFKHYYFLNQIVSNPVNGIDTDRLDYLARDTLSVGLGLSFNATRILKCYSVFKFDGRYYLSYSQKAKFDIMQVYHTRYILNKIMYNHPKVLAFDYLIVDIFTEAATLGIINVDSNYAAIPPPDDRMLYLIENAATTAENTQKPYFKRLNTLLGYLTQHRTPRVVFETALTQDSRWVLEGSRVQRSRAFKQEIEKYSGISASLFEVQFSDISYGVRGYNPLDFIPVHSKDQVHVPYAFASKYGPERDSDCVYVKNVDGQETKRDGSSQSAQSGAPTTVSSPVKPVDGSNSPLSVKAVQRLHSDLLMPERFKESGIFVFVYPHNYTEDLVARLKDAILQFLRRNELLSPVNALYFGGALEFNDADCLTDRAVSPQMPGPMELLRMLKSDEM